MKKFLYLAMLFIGFALTAKAQTSADAITGIWLTAPKDGKIEIYKESDKYFGKIVWGKEPGRKDDKNPDASLRNRDLMGTVLLRNFTFNGKDKWESGTIYDPNNGKTYSCNIKLKDKNRLEVRGYIGFSLLGRTEVWTRP
jgi:uncharacterized protein (DUF2147 family)